MRFIFGEKNEKNFSDRIIGSYAFVINISVLAKASQSGGTIELIGKECGP